MTDANIKKSYTFFTIFCEKYPDILYTSDKAKNSKIFIVN